MTFKIFFVDSPTPPRFIFVCICFFKKNDALLTVVISYGNLALDTPRGCSNLLNLAYSQLDYHYNL